MSTLTKALIAFVPVSVLLIYSLAAFTKRRTAATVFLMLGAACLLVVVLTHLAEALHLFPIMGFGEPHSVGHYIDLSSAAGGVALLVGTAVLRLASAQSGQPAERRRQSLLKTRSAPKRVG